MIEEEAFHILSHIFIFFHTHSLFKTSTNTPSHHTKNVHRNPIKRKEYEHIHKHSSSIYPLLLWSGRCADCFIDISRNWHVRTRLHLFYRDTKWYSVSLDVGSSWWDSVTKRPQPLSVSTYRSNIHLLKIDTHGISSFGQIEHIDKRIGGCLIYSEDVVS
jgi:hypothetical protein